MRFSWEVILLWGGSLLIVMGIFTVYLRQFKRREKDNLFTKREAVELGLDRPPVQHPNIDSYACIGCGSCVAACPEGDVLGMVSGKATIINGLRCVGHGECAKACPVGAVKVGLGDRSKREDLPLLDERLETTREGVFIAGELGGLGLIRHAVSQGRTAVLNAIEGLEPANKHIGTSQTTEHADVIVVGAGPAGLSAAITAWQQGFRVMVLEQGVWGGAMLHYPRKSLVLTQPVEIPNVGWLKKPHYAKEELLAIWEKAISDSDVCIEEGVHVAGIEGQRDAFLIHTSQKTYTARRIILAMGRSGIPRKLGAPGEEMTKVAYQLVDAVNFTNDHILVVGGGDSAVEAALALARQPGNTVTLSYRRGRFFRIRKINLERLDAAVDAGSLKVLYHSNVSEIHKDDVVLQVQDQKILLPNAFVFVMIGGIPPFGLLKKCGVQLGGPGVTTDWNKGIA